MRTISFNFSTFFFIFLHPSLRWGVRYTPPATTDNRIVFVVTESFMWIVIHWLIKPSPYVNCDWVINWLIDWLIDCTESFLWIVIDWLCVVLRPVREYFTNQCRWRVPLLGACGPSALYRAILAMPGDADLQGLIWRTIWVSYMYLLRQAGDTGDLYWPWILWG